ncbi:hypothetical protein ACVW0Y_004377 [Pseudomonas sp. TE3786]
MTRVLSLFFTALALTVSSQAQAHGLYCQCQALGDEQVRCIGGLSDGTALPGTVLDVIGYDQKTLVAGKLGADSSYTFRRPEGEFYVLMELGPGHTVEVDHRDISSR